MKATFQINAFKSEGAAQEARHRKKRSYQMLKVIAAVITLALCITGLAAFASLFEPLPHPVTGMPLSFVESTILGSIMFHIAILAVVSGGYLLHTASVRQFG